MILAAYFARSSASPASVACAGSNYFDFRRVASKDGDGTFPVARCSSQCASYSELADSVATQVRVQASAT